MSSRIPGAEGSFPFEPPMVQMPGSAAPPCGAPSHARIVSVSTRQHRESPRVLPRRFFDHGTTAAFLHWRAARPHCPGDHGPAGRAGAFPQVGGDGLRLRAHPIGMLRPRAAMRFASTPPFIWLIWRMSAPVFRGMPPLQTIERVSFCRSPSGKRRGETRGALS